MQVLKAKDLANPRVKTVPLTWPVSELAAFFVEEAITGAPVVDEDSRPVGVVSLMDIARDAAMHDHAIGPEHAADYFVRGWEDKISDDELQRFHVSSVSENTVADIMTPTIFKVHANASVAEMAQTMLNGRIHRLLVTEEERIIGIVTSIDLLRLLVRPQAVAA